MNRYLITYRHEGSTIRDTADAETMTEALRQWMTVTDPGDAEEWEAIARDITSVSVELWCRVS